jgi:ABC-type branched-subunit amino acid transport system substrate-binding protein
VPSDAVVTDAGWGQLDGVSLRALYGLDRLDSAAGLAAAGDLAKGVTFATFGYPVPGSELDELYEKYRLAYGARPDGSEVQLGYNALRVIDKAVQQAKTTDPKAMAADLPGLSIGGAGGVLDYPEDGSRQPRADVAVVQVRDGRLELVHGGRPERP